DCPDGIPLPNGENGLPDPGILAAVQADPNCFSFVEIAPGGFVPRFGGDLEDQSLVLGFRGELDIGSGLGYDVSASYGRNEAVFFIGNTINASLGPNTPRRFTPGAYEQTDMNINLDLIYSVPVDGFASDLSIAGGIEWREEQFDITAGDPASFAIGPLAAPSPAFPTGQGFSSSSNGFGGFTRSTSDTQDNIALYVELEADINDNLTLLGAARYEDFNTFGDTTNFKIGFNQKFGDTTRLRGTFSTGFHAPTTGQANVTNVTTAFVGTALVDQGTLPLSSAAGQFVNAQLGNPFTLGPEEADNFSLGTAFELGGASITLDYFKIDVDDRISITDQQDFQGLLSSAAASAGVPLPANAQTSQILNALNAAGVLNAADFAGSEDLTSFAFFANDFDTSTEGLDLVINYPFEFRGGSSSIAVAFNYTDTEVTRRGNLSDTRKLQLEENLPNVKGIISWRHNQDNWRLMTRMNYHSSYKEAHLDSGDLIINPGAEFTFDAEFGYTFNEKYDIIVGAANIFDSFPDTNQFAGIAGSLYPATAPFGFSGGQYYIRGRYDF
ncbi:MAG: TonB-dependent receptor, partial [Arenicella sp.]|nr:TonB-dependent receptor [Arenicella sp.]